MKNFQKLPPFFVALTCTTLFGLAFAQDSSLNETGREMLVLRNGQILEGRITKIKDHYLVDMPNGEIHVRAADADFVCRNLTEGYDRKRAVIPPGDWREHLELARWCFKHNLREQATAELSLANAASPNNPLIAVLKRQMEPVPEPAAGPEKTAVVEEGVSNEELDRMVRNLPPGTMEAFTQTVQPLLMNNCTTTGCHGPQSTNNLRLFRVSTGQVANRRLTQRNLQTVLQYIDRENPAQSPLLTIPAAPHGTAKKAVYSEHRSGQYTRLAHWVMGFDPDNQIHPDARWANRSPVKNLPSDSPDEQAMPSEPELLSPEAQMARPLADAKKSPRINQPEAEEVPGEITPTSYQEPPAGFLQPGRAVPQRKSPSEPPRLPATANPKVKRGAPLPQEGSKDPFDPAIFNRRYHKSDTPPEEKIPPSEENTQKNPPNGR